MEMNNVDLFDLHDLLLDYINNNTKTDPEKA